jgi:DNA invertase Pin-like site-specific DNA recombinase
MKKQCFECGDVATAEHHVVPQVKGGTKTVPLCDKCHSLVHDSDFVSLSALSKEGKKRARNTEIIAKVLELFEQGVSKKQIAKLVNINRNTVYSILERNGLHENTSKGCKLVLTSKTVRDIQKLRRKRWSWESIAKKTGVSRSQIYRLLSAEEWIDGLYGGDSKKRTTYRTLTENKKQEALKMANNGISWAEISRRLGVDRTTLYKHKLHKE